jgi:4'-phosphopantetheinyl transferase EntD
MGIISKNHLQEDCVLGIWEITESFQELYDSLTLSTEDEQRLFSFKSAGRRLEWLSVRKLLQTLTNDTKARITYDKNRKPFLYDQSYNVSISHSHNITAILLSKNRRVGLDLEYMSHRISNVAFKFINENEFITDDEKYKRYHLYIHWCAKEALYKICDKQDINFKQNLTILPFQQKESGLITGIVNNRYITEEFPVHYFRTGNYVTAWCCK